MLNKFEDTDELFSKDLEIVEIARPKSRLLPPVDEEPEEKVDDVGRGPFILTCGILVTVITLLVAYAITGI